MIHHMHHSRTSLGQSSHIMTSSCGIQTEELITCEGFIRVAITEVLPVLFKIWGYVPQPVSHAVYCYRTCSICDLFLTQRNNGNQHFEYMESGHTYLASTESLSFDPHLVHNSNLKEGI